MWMVSTHYNAPMDETTSSISATHGSLNKVQEEEGDVQLHGVMLGEC